MAWYWVRESIMSYLQWQNFHRSYFPTSSKFGKVVLRFRVKVVTAHAQISAKKLFFLHRCRGQSAWSLQYTTLNRIMNVRIIWPMSLGCICEQYYHHPDVKKHLLDIVCTVVLVGLLNLLRSDSPHREEQRALHEDIAVRIHQDEYWIIIIIIDDSFCQRMK